MKLRTNFSISNASWFPPLLGVVVLIALWAFLNAAQIVDPLLLPSPLQSWNAFVSGMVEGSLGHDFLRTIVRTMLSFAIATVISVPLGVALGSSAKLYRSVEFLIDFFRSTPASALFPLFLVFFGIGEEAKIAVAAFGAALIIVFNTAYGVMNARQLRQLAAKVMGASKARILWDVTIWESLPQTFIGLRSGVSMALVIVIVAEMFIGSSDGLGKRIIDAQMVFNMPEMYASIFAAGALGYVMNALFTFIEARFVHWSGK